MRRFFKADGSLTKLGNWTCTSLAGAYALAIALLCFLPQNLYPQYKDFSTPGIIQVGRLYFLPTPFNSIINGDKVDSLANFGWIVLQNMTNIFLLFPLVFYSYFYGKNGGAFEQLLFILFVSAFLSSACNCFWIF